MGKEALSNLATANLQFRVEPGRIPWIYSVLRNQREVEMYSGDFSEPFEKLTYVLRHNQNQLAVVAALQIGNEFKERYGDTIGSPEDLNPLLKRYPKHEFSPDGAQLAVFDNGGQIQGIIARLGDQIVIQRGGGVGQLVLSEKDSNPINNLSVMLDSFNLLIQRYVSAIWKSSPETDKKKFQLVLDVPAIPDGAPQTYFSTFEIIGNEFRENSRPVDLDMQIGGYQDVKTAIRNLFLNQTQPEESRRHGLQPYANKFLLITGSEGTGKTLFPKALYKMLRDHYGGGETEHFRLPFADMLRKYGSYAAALTITILDHVRENEKKGVVTLVHMDGLEHFIPQYQRPKEVTANLGTADYQVYYQPQTPPSDVEFSYAIQTLEPLIEVIRQFGKDVGADSHNVIVYGESRAPREFLPEGIARTFRRTFSLDKPTAADVHDILRAQINSTKEFAQSTRRNPFEEDVESRLQEIASHAIGLNGRLIQQAMLTIATRKNVEGLDLPITYIDLCNELDNIRMARGLLTNGSNRKMGFNLPYWNK